MSVKKRDQQKNLAFSDCFTLQNLNINFIILLPLKFPRCVAISLKSEVHPQFPKSRTVEALNINKSVSQSEKVIPAGFWRRNRAVSIWLQKLAPVKIWRQTVWHTLQNLASNLWRRFLAPVSGACVVGLMFTGVRSAKFDLRFRRSCICFPVRAASQKCKTCIKSVKYRFKNSLGNFALLFPYFYSGFQKVYDEISWKFTYLCRNFMETSYGMGA